MLITANNPSNWTASKVEQWAVFTKPKAKVIYMELFVQSDDHTLNTFVSMGERNPTLKLKPFLWKKISASLRSFQRLCIIFLEADSLRSLQIMTHMCNAYALPCSFVMCVIYK